MANRKRSTEKEEFWRLAVSEFGSSGQSVREFCRSQGLGEASFYSWRREIARRDAESSAANAKQADVLGKLIPVNVVDMSDATLPPEDETMRGASGRIEILTSDGMTIRLDDSMALPRLRNVLGVITELQRGVQPC